MPKAPSITSAYADGQAAHSMNSPKVIISYSWTTPLYQQEVMALADRLMQHGGVEVIIDDYDLKEGHDIVAYMERLKNDDSLNHCLILSDAAYAKKADERKKGVGTEAQIISKEIYDSVEQTRFVPVVMEVMEDGKPWLPTFLQNRKYIDFSSPEKLNQNWEQLVRLLHGKPSRVKPKVGSAPAFLDEKNTGLFIQTRIAFAPLRHSLMEGKPGVAIHRDELLQSFLDELNTALLLEPDGKHKDQGEDDLLTRWERCLRAQPEGRDIMIDWILLETKIDADGAAQKCIIPLLESLYSISLGPKGHPDISIISDSIKILTFEMALYAIACLINVDSSTALHKVLHHPFVNPNDYRHRATCGLNSFQHHSDMCDFWNSKLSPGWISPISAKIKERATHHRISFPNLIEAEALIFVFNILSDTLWYPASAAYCEYGSPFRWFSKAKNSSSPDRFALVTEKQNWSVVRDEFIGKMQEHQKRGGWSILRGGYIAAMGFELD